MKKVSLFGLCVSAAALLGACAKKEEAVLVPAAPVAALPAAPAAVPAAPAPATTPVAPPADPAPAAAVAGAGTTAAPAASTDLDEPTALPSRQIKGVGLKQAVTYYYTFNAGAGTIKLEATAKNAPSGAAQALLFGLYDKKANRLCYDSHGNTTTDKTITINCTVDKAQPLILRLDLGSETIDYAVSLDGPVELPPPQAATAATPVAGAGSSDIDAPTRLAGNKIKGEGPKKAASYYYAFNAGPGELTVTADGMNSSAATTEALHTTLYTIRSEKLCNVALGNTTVEKRAVIGCKLDKRQPVILRLDVSPETTAYRVRFDGPYDFEPFEIKKEVVIALDAAVLFDSGKFALKPEAKQTLDEAADRVKKFKGAAVTIAGYTDSVGNDASNKRLSDQRAAAVRDYFVNTSAVPAAGLTVRGLGEAQPVADNKTEEGRARNRRVEVVIKPAAP